LQVSKRAWEGSSDRKTVEIMGTLVEVHVTRQKKTLVIEYVI